MNRTKPLIIIVPVSILTGYLFLLSGFLSPLRAQNDPMASQKPYKIRLKILQESYLVIQGESNVNNFQCFYENTLRRDTLNMTAYRQDNCLYFENASLSLATNAFDCGNKQMNKDLQELLKNDRYPDITIDLSCINTGIPNHHELVSNQSGSSNISLLADITIAGTTREQLLPVEIFRSGNERNYHGTISLNLNKYNIDPPTKMLGLIRVKENIDVNFFVKIALLESELEE